MPLRNLQARLRLDLARVLCWLVVLSASGRFTHAGPASAIIAPNRLAAASPQETKAQTTQPQPPNIVVILCDDLGYGDVRCFNPDSKISTPHMDALAAAGMRFTDMHSGSAVCSPTRYGLLTGRYAWRSPLQSGVLGGLSPHLIEDGRLTLPEFLRRHGYRTACIGKWHLGMDWTLLPGRTISPLGIESPAQVHNVDYSQPVRNGPTSRGFDEFFGISASLDMVPYAYIQNDRLLGNPTQDRDFPMVAGNSRARTRHGPASPGFQAVDVLPRLTAEAVDFISTHAREARSGHPFFLYLPLNSPHSPILPAPEWAGRSGINPYADFVMQTDATIGQIIAAIDQQRLARNTLFIVTSDNGCSPVANFDQRKKAGHAWSYIYRGAKADIYEGGHRVPFIARWPEHISPNTLSSHTQCLTDLFATCAHILGAPLPDDAAEDSFSFLPQLQGSQPTTLRPPVVHHSINGSFALRRGPWKLAVCPGSGGWSFPRPGRDGSGTLPEMQLFNLDTDAAEQTNLLKRYPNIAREFLATIETIASNGRSNPGPPRTNTVPVEIHRRTR